MRVSGLGLLAPLLAATGCATVAPVSLDIRAHQGAHGVRFEGALAGPYDSFDDLVQTACQQMRAQPAGTRQAGYCALPFLSTSEGEKWRLSAISPLRAETRTGDRSCALPWDALKPEQRDVLFLGGGTGPMASRGPSGWTPTRFLDRTHAATWDQDTLVFSLDGEDGCTVFHYVAFARELSVFRDGHWRTSATLYNKEGLIQALRD